MFTNATKCQNVLTNISAWRFDLGESHVQPPMDGQGSREASLHLAGGYAPNYWKRFFKIPDNTSIEAKPIKMIFYLQNVSGKNNY